jgi:hypothetical protein
MFIQHLNIEQQSALYCLSKKLIGADGYIDDRESLLLETIVGQCDENVDLGRVFELDELSTLFSKSSEKMAFLIELVGVGYADQTLEGSEDDFIKQVSETIGIELNLLEQVKFWVQRQMDLVVESQKLLGV